MSARLEHLNINVDDPLACAERLCELLGWQLRWQGRSSEGGYTVHVGGEQSYLALYAPPRGLDAASPRYRDRLGLNHIGVVVDDLAGAEQRFVAAGLQPHGRADYPPGKRFYVDLPEGLEIEVVCYATA